MISSSVLHLNLVRDRASQRQGTPEIAAHLFRALGSFCFRPKLSSPRYLLPDSHWEEAELQFLTVSGAPEILLQRMSYTTVH